MLNSAYSRKLAIGFCSNKQRLAATQHTTSNSTITICPASFEIENHPLSDIKITKIDFNPPAPVERAQLGSTGDDLGSYTPTSATLFHDLFQLVLWSGAIYSSLGDICDIYNILQVGVQDASKTP